MAPKFRSKKQATTVDGHQYDAWPEINWLYARVTNWLEGSFKSLQPDDVATKGEWNTENTSP